MYKNRTSLSHHLGVLLRLYMRCGILTRVDSEEAVQPSVKPRNSKCCSVSSLIIIEYSSKSKCSDQSLSLCWSHIPHFWISHAVAHFICQITDSSIELRHISESLFHSSLGSYILFVSANKTIYYMFCGKYHDLSNE